MIVTLFRTNGHRPRAATAVAALALLAASGCGKAAENLAERGIEEAIERESGGEVDVDLGGGGFNVETDEGSIRVGDDGSFVVEGQDGEVITGGADDDGFNFQSEDGDNVFRAGDGIPSEWPSDIPRPDGLTTVQGTYTSSDGFAQTTVVGTPSGTAADYLQAYAASLEGLGYERTSLFEGNGNSQYTFEGPTYIVTLFGNDNGAPTVTVGVSPSQQ
ncbi:MAG: hypothetical protein HKN44_02450 [Ilumatobacter sp.]|nr:hypothetical protein [Ilumatobacter sp.]